MIQRIEHGWVQVNDSLSKRQQRQRRRPPRPKGRKGEEGRVHKPLFFIATIDLVAFVRTDPAGTFFSP